MKINSAIKTTILSSFFSLACSNQKTSHYFQEIKPEKTITMILDSLANQKKFLVNNGYIQYGKDTILVNIRDIKAPEKLTKRLNNLSNQKNPYIIKPHYDPSCYCLKSKQMFNETKGVINSEKVFCRGKNQNNYYLPVEFFGKK